LIQISMEVWKAARMENWKSGYIKGTIDAFESIRKIEEKYEEDYEVWKAARMEDWKSGYIKGTIDAFESIRKIEEKYEEDYEVWKAAYIKAAVDAYLTRKAVSR
jgi:hypothetical protein